MTTNYWLEVHVDLACPRCATKEPAYGVLGAVHNLDEAIALSAEHDAAEHRGDDKPDGAR